MTTIILDGDSLTIKQTVQIARENAQVEIAAAARAEIIKKRAYIEENWLTENAPPTYGFNTGVGKLKDYKINQADNEQFQLNIVLSHCSGIGKPASEEIVRAMMAVRINAFCVGVSGLRIEVVDRLVQMLNSGVHPVVPIQGSVGASGDLAPLAHMVSVLIGYEDAEAIYKGERMSAPKALELAGISPVSFELKAKDCLALINGNSLCAGMGALTLHDAEELMKTADAIGALSLEAIRGEQAAFDARIHEVRKQPGQILTAENIRRMVEGSRRASESARAVHLEDDILHPTYHPRVQDQYSFRCLPQVHGSCRDQLEHAKTVLTRELNAATDNPLVFWNENGALEFLSGGNFHCEPIAFAMDLLAIALIEIGNISERRLFALCDTTLNYGLPPNLAGKPIGLNYGYGIISTAAAAVASENKTLAFPSVADTIPTKSSQEDHVSMAAWSCRKAQQVLDNLPKIIGVECLLATKAIFLTRHALGSFKLGRGTQPLYDALAAVIPLQDGDGYMQKQIKPAFAMVTEGKVLNVVETAIGPLR
ncbi:MULTISPECIES: histidine ammonia-lyase [Rhizobium/Agrobacterium group]|uniref:Histidine ammonia-lyase n=2 Tax=Rhizobium/Agrobacterium group TaxID=227290 RepID=B9K5K4_ALLAM|nr:MULTISPECIES: histidine ammonia-lyase [Rhizobium/Agrobacterium group]ACM40152.1 histidine ammonia-lyase [Allorhizobium ampelinum S4]MCF1449085.1 histidine ammonia-lyase [Allorhizobium ampelinum]MCF1495800.1 histidine ammonia-lyase [Allorhizobium ampelinum]MUO28373.1 histidine ammonia-lyase [Agrobacterium vitis]MUO41255.1 histidine ammonia-lyase [Agrobacterium vitis]